MTQKVTKKTQEIPVCIVCKKTAHTYEDNIYYCATHMLEKLQGVQSKCYKKQSKNQNTYSRLKG